MAGYRMLVAGPYKTLLTATFASCLLLGCSFISGDGPDSLSIMANAQVYGSSEETLPYALVDLSSASVGLISDIQPDSIFRTLGLGQGSPPVTAIGTGDTVQVSIFESAAGGLFIPSDAGARPGNYVQLPPQLIDSTGILTIPYAGSISVLNKTLNGVAAEIEARIANRAIEPKVIVSLVNQRAPEVTLVGEVKNANKITIGPKGDRVLDVIAKAGGLAFPGSETYVTVTRAGRAVKVWFPVLVNDSQENVYVRPGDQIYVARNARRFSILGATALNAGANAAQNSSFAFESERMSLMDAVAKSGGLSDSRADPTQVFIFREEAKVNLERLKVDISQFLSSGETIPAVFKVDFSKPDAFFVARGFLLRDSDVVYIGYSGSNEYTKFMTIIGMTAGNYNATRAAFR